MHIDIYIPKLRTWLTLLASKMVVGKYLYKKSIQLYIYIYIFY